MSSQYRLKASKSGSNKYLQFKSKKTFLLRTFDCWRYVPSSYAAGVFKEKKCPTKLPFATSHCYMLFSELGRGRVLDFIRKYPNVQDWLDELKAEKDKDYSNELL